MEPEKVVSRLFHKTAQFRYDFLCAFLLISQPPPEESRWANSQSWALNGASPSAGWTRT